MSLLTTLVEVSEMLTKANVEFVIGGSLASSLWGQERTTHDADIAVLLSQDQLTLLDGLVGWPYVMDTASIRASLSQPKEFASGQILNGETLDKIDLFLLIDGPYTRAELTNRRFVEVVPGVFLPFASPEDIVITKLRWYVLGNQVSDRQWNDIVQILEIQGGQIDSGYMRKWADCFGVTRLLREAQEQIVSDD